MIKQLNKFQIVLDVLTEKVTQEEVYLQYSVTKAEFDLWEQQFLTAAKEALYDSREVCQRMALDESLWFTDGFDTSMFPDIYAHEYSRIHKLLSAKEPYGALLQIKDFYEVLLKFPILSTVSFWVSQQPFDQLTQSYKEVIFKIVKEKLTLGKWLEIARTIINIQQKEKVLLFPEKQLHTILQAVYKLYDDHKIVNWRNKNIGHGSLGTFEDETFQQNLENQLRNIRDHLSEITITTLYNQVKVFQEEKDWMIQIKDTRFYIDPFMYIDNEDVLLFEGYDAASSFVEYLNYKRGKKTKKHQEKIHSIVHYFSETKKLQSSSLQELDSDYKEDIQNFEERISYLDFLEPSYLTSWITTITKEKPNGYLYLVMEEGMGKTTLVQAIDELKLNKWDSPKLIRRAVYFNNYKENQLQTLKEDMISSLRTVVVSKKETKTLNTYLSFDPKDQLDPQQFYNVLTAYFKQLKSEIGKEKLIFTLDGLDELTSVNRERLLQTLLEMPPLPEGLYVLLTAKYQYGETIKLPEELKAAPRTVRQDDLFNIKLLVNYAKDKLKYKDEAAQQFVTNLDDKRMLIIQPYSMLRKQMPDARVESMEDVMSYYMRYLRQLYGQKYFGQISQLAALLAFSPKPLTLEEISYLLNGINPGFELLGQLNDLRYWLKVRKKQSVNTYSLVNTSIRDTLQKQDFYQDELRTLASNWLQLIEQDYSKIDSLPSYVGLLFEYLSQMKFLKLPKNYKETLPLVARYYYETADSFERLEQAITLLKIERDRLKSREAAYLVSEAYMKMLDADQALLEMDFLFPLLIGQERTALFFKSLQLQWLLLKKTDNGDEVLIKGNNQLYAYLKTNKKNALSLLRHSIYPKKKLPLKSFIEAIENNHSHLVFYYEYALLHIRVFAKNRKDNDVILWGTELTSAIRQKVGLTLYDRIFLCYLDGLLLYGYTMLLTEETKILNCIEFEYPTSFFVDKVFSIGSSFIDTYYEYFASLQRVVAGIESLKKEFPLLNEQAFIIMPEFHLGLFKFEEISKLTMYHRMEAERFFRGMMRTTYSSQALIQLQIELDQIEESRLLNKENAIAILKENLPTHSHRQRMSEYIELLIELPLSEEKYILANELLTMYNSILYERLETIPVQLSKEVHYLYAVIGTTSLQPLVRGSFLFEYGRMIYYEIFKVQREPSIIAPALKNVLDVFYQGYSVLKESIINGKGMQRVYIDKLLPYIYRITLEIKYSGVIEHEFIKLVEKNEVLFLRKNPAV
ncbi:hypothetical protein CN481_15690 [Bacillus sp. AFS006103]|nr:hypothetical protein CN481_15690 [Bacillus sp. AFS006103]